MTISVYANAFSEPGVKAVWEFDIYAVNPKVIEQVGLPESAVLLSLSNYTSEVSLKKNFCTVFYNPHDQANFSFRIGEIKDNNGYVGFYLPEESDFLDTSELTTCIVKPNQKGVQVYVW